MAGLLGSLGVAAWITLTCRDRNRVVLEQELSSLRHVGIDGVLCVTGDARASGVRPEATVWLIYAAAHNISTHIIAMHKIGLSSVWGRPTTPSCRSSSRLSSNLFLVETN